MAVDARRRRPAHDLDRAAADVGWRYLTAPGWIRAAWMTALFLGIGLGLVVLFRWWAGWEPLFDWQVITVVATLTAAPLGFLAGLGALRLLGALRARRADAPEDHSGHGGRTWQDYFRPTPTTR